MSKHDNSRVSHLNFSIGSQQDFLIDKLSSPQNHFVVVSAGLIKFKKLIMIPQKTTN